MVGIRNDLTQALRVGPMTIARRAGDPAGPRTRAAPSAAASSRPAVPTCRASRRLAGLALAVALATSAAALAASKPEEPKSQILFIGPDTQPIEGKIISQDENGFTFRITVAEVETDVWLPWSVLSATEVDRIRGPKGGSALEELLARGGGDLIPATRFHFKNGHVLVGLELTEKSTPEEIVICRRNAPEMRIPREDIRRVETVMLPETEFYSLDELYQRRKAEIDPHESGRRHFRLAQEMEKIRNYEKAREHFERASLLDEGLSESAGRKMAEMDVALTEGEVRRLDQQIEADIRGGRLVDAIRMIRRIAALDPDSPIRTKWEAQLSQLEEKLHKTLRRDLVNSYYRKMDELIRKWSHGFVPRSGEVLRVVVRTRDGKKFIGRLISDGEEFITVESRRRRVKIAKNRVSDVRHVAPRARHGALTLAESKKYVRDTSGGLTADILRDLEEAYAELSTPELPITQELIQSYWNDRLTSVVIYDGRGREEAVPVYSWHEASYGSGSWLREGYAIVSVGGGRKGPETNMEKWWKSQPYGLRYQVLRAFAAEALCHVDKVVKIRCPNCGGRGGITQIGMMDLGRSEKVCPVCRGGGVFIKIRYR